MTLPYLRRRQPAAQRSEASRGLVRSGSAEASPGRKPPIVFGRAGSPQFLDWVGEIDCGKAADSVLDERDIDGRAAAAIRRNG